MPWGVLEHIWTQSELSHSGLKFTKNAIGLSVVGGKGVYLVVCGNSLEKPWFEWQLEAVWSLNAKQSGQQVLPWSRTSVSTKVLLHKHRVIISNEVGYIQISLMRTCVFKKVWKTSKIYDGNRYLGNLLQIHFFPSEMLLESEALLCSFLSLNLMGNTFFGQNFGLLCPKSHLTFSMADADHSTLSGSVNFIFSIPFPWHQKPTMQRNFSKMDSYGSFVLWSLMLIFSIIKWVWKPILKQQNQLIFLKSFRYNGYYWRILTS